MVLADWMSTFRPFGWMHLIVVVICAAIMITAVVLGRRWRSKPETTSMERTARWIIAAMMLAFQAGQQAWYLLPANFKWGDSLPLHVCDIIGWLTPIALVTQLRPLRAMLYFWGIGLSTQAFFTPILRFGPDHAHFWFFWIGHLLIVGGAIYDIAALRFRPRFHDFLFAVLTSLGYVGLVMLVNHALRDHTVNYGYVGNLTPLNPTLIDRLGPWPWRVVWLCLIGTAGFAAIWLAWPLAARLRGQRAAS